MHFAAPWLKSCIRLVKQVCLIRVAEKAKSDTRDLDQMLDLGLLRCLYCLFMAAVAHFQINKQFFVSLFNIGPYDRQKSMQKTGKNIKNFRGGGKDFSGWPEYIPLWFIPETLYLSICCWSSEICALRRSRELCSSVIFSPDS